LGLAEIANYKIFKMLQKSPEPTPAFFPGGGLGVFLQQTNIQLVTACAKAPLKQRQILRYSNL